MSSAEQMLDSYPGTFEFDTQQLADAIDALLDCIQTCTACADACLAEACRRCERPCQQLLDAM